MAKKNKKTIKKNQVEKKEFFSTRISQLISIFCFIIGYLFYKYDEIILFNFKWWYFIILFLLMMSLILLILNIPIIKRKLIESNYWDASILISIYYAILVSIPFYYGLKHIIYDFSKEPIITENCEILEKEAIRIMRKLPKMTPGKQNGKPVKVKYSQTLTFKLQ